MAAKKPPYSSSNPPQTSSVAEKLEFAEIKNAIQALREEIRLSRESANQEFNFVKENLNQVIKNLEHVNVEMKQMKEINDKNAQRIQKVEEKTQFHDTKIDELITEEKRNERTSTILEFDRAEFYLRFQNIPEEKGENLQEILGEILAEAMEEDKEKIMMDIDESFRVTTRYALRHNLPREVHVRFTKKMRRTQILQKVRITNLKYKEKEIIILKQIPRKVRDLRREYQFLTTKLHQRGINFRWLVPEGIFLIWQGQRYRLDSVNKAELFFHQKFEQTEEGAKEMQVIVRQKEPAVREEGLKELSEEYLLAVASGGAEAPFQEQEAPKTVESKEQRVMTRAAKERQKP